MFGVAVGLGVGGAEIRPKSAGREQRLSGATVKNGPKFTKKVVLMRIVRTASVSGEEESWDMVKTMLSALNFSESIQFFCVSETSKF
jgi:hypothetical protein